MITEVTGPTPSPGQGTPARSTLKNQQTTKDKKNRQSIPRLVEGAIVTGWKAALGELALVYPDRINHHL